MLDLVSGDLIFVLSVGFCNGEGELFGEEFFLEFNARDFGANFSGFLFLNFCGEVVKFSDVPVR